MEHTHLSSAQSVLAIIPLKLYFSANVSIGLRMSNHFSTWTEHKEKHFPGHRNHYIHKYTKPAKSKSWSEYPHIAAGLLVSVFVLSHKYSPVFQGTHWLTRTFFFDSFLLRGLHLLRFLHPSEVFLFWCQSGPEATWIKGKKFFKLLQSYNDFNK